MARRVYFAFHYRDVASFRANVVRNSWVTKPDREEAGFFDESLWEQAKTNGEDAIKRLINKALEGTSVTAVLIGAETSTRKWVKYELEQGWKRGNGILGIYIHQIKDKDGKTDTKGNTFFGPIFTSSDDDKRYFSERFSTYDWVDDDGYNYLGGWIEKAAEDAGR